MSGESFHMSGESFHIFCYAWNKLFYGASKSGKEGNGQDKYPKYSISKKVTQQSVTFYREVFVHGKAALSTA